MINNKYISLVLPCRNEEKALSSLLQLIPKEIDEVIVVDNQSTDKTAELAQKFKVKVLFEKQNKNGIGYGFALAHGIRQAKGDIIVCMDGDDSYPVKQVPQLIKQLDLQQLDFASCNRLTRKTLKDMSAVRIFGVAVLNKFVSLLFGFKISDCLSGMWIFRREVLNDLVLSDGGWNFSLEIKLNVLTNPALKFAEFNIPYHDRLVGASKQNLLKTGIEHLLFLLEKRFMSHKLAAVQPLLLTNR